MELYKKLLQRIENDEPIYCNKTFAKDLERIANEHHQEQVNIILGDVSKSFCKCKNPKIVRNKHIRGCIRCDKTELL